MKFEASEQYFDRALKSIPLGTQTFSKSMLTYPKGASPIFIDYAKGAMVTDIDGNHFLDFVNALLCVSIGYADDDINDAVKKQIDKGVSFSLPTTLETEVAELLIDLVPSAEMVRFGKNGSDSTSAAIRLARAFTKKDIVLVCGYHGWQDWYIGSTVRDLGVPKAVKELTHHFKYNDIDSLSSLFTAYKGRVAAVIMEPMNVAFPQDNFLENVKSITHENNAVLIFDETITGCRFAKGGAQEFFGVVPDLACFGKGLANGFPLSAVMGKKEIMMYMEDIFYSGTFGGETASLAAAKATLNKVKNENVVDKIYANGTYLIDKLNLLIQKNEAWSIFSVSGHPAWSFFHISDYKNYSSIEIKTLFMQEMIKRKVLTIGTHNLSAAHEKKDIDFLLGAYEEIIPYIKEVVLNGSLHDAVNCEMLKPVFKVR